MSKILRTAEGIAFISTEKSLARTQWLLLVLVLTGFLIYYGIGIRTNLIDFEVFYRAGERFLAGESLYRADDGHLSFKYLPVNALFFSLWAMLPYPIGKLVWFVLILVGGWLFINICFHLASEESGTQKPASPFLYVFSILIVGTYWHDEAGFGQTNLIMYLCLMLSAYAMLRDRPLKAALWWCLALVVKPYALLFLPYMLWKRKIQTLVYSLLLGTIAFFMPMLRYGFGRFWDVLAEIQTTAGASSSVLASDMANASLFGLYAKMGIQDYPTIALWATVTALVLSLIFAVWSFGKINRDRFSAELAVLFLMMPLVSPQGWRYVFWVAGVGVIWVLVRWQGIPWWGKLGSIFAFMNMALIQYELLGKKLFEMYLQTPIFIVSMLLFIAVLIGSSSMYPSLNAQKTVKS